MVSRSLHILMSNQRLLCAILAQIWMIDSRNIAYSCSTSYKAFQNDRKHSHFHCLKVLQRYLERPRSPSTRLQIPKGAESWLGYAGYDDCIESTGYLLTNLQDQ